MRFKTSVQHLPVKPEIVVRLKLVDGIFQEVLAFFWISVYDLDRTQVWDGYFLGIKFLQVLEDWTVQVVPQI